MVRRAIIAMAVMAAIIAAPVSAQNYRFSVDENRSDIFVREDGGIDIEYALTFTCAPGAHPIDIVDVGLPNNYYKLSSVNAWIDGEPVKKVRKSSEIPIGVEVHLGGRQIGPGRTGTLQLTATNPRMVFPDTEDPDYASVEFYPTYYGSKFTTGSTKLQVAIHFPEGAVGDEVKWHYREFDDHGYDEDGRLTYIWRDNNASPSRQYKFGVSFPDTLVNQVFETIPESHYTSPGIVEGISTKLLSLFFRYPPLFVILIGFTISFLNYLIKRRRKMKYFPPAAAVEGAEVKRGLAAPEAAILLELPLNKVVAMIVFGLVKKGVVRVVPSDELKLKELKPDAGELRSYERDFLAVIKKDGTLSQSQLKKFFVKTIKAVHKKLKGFNFDKTREYYRSIVSLAWSQVQKSESTAELSRNLDEQFVWLMADKDMEGRLKQTLGERQVQPPIWWTSYHPTSTWSHTRASGEARWVGGVDFADGVVSRIESVADGAVARLESLTSGVTQATNPPPVRTYSSGGGGCACACAGCACACAGGRR